MWPFIFFCFSSCKCTYVASIIYGLQAVSSSKTPKAPSQACRGLFPGHLGPLQVILGLLLKPPKILLGLGKGA